MVANGFPGIQYVIVNADTFQRFLIIKYQALSSTDPTDPPDFNPVLSDCGKLLNIVIPVSPVLTNPELLTDKRNTWMSDGINFESDKYSRLTGLGTAIADLKRYCGNEKITMKCSLPLAHKCIEVLGHYSISNFMVEPNEYNQRYYPVIVEFKLKMENQSVKKRQIIRTSIWNNNGNSSNKSSKKT